MVRAGGAIDHTSIIKSCHFPLVPISSDAKLKRRRCSRWMDREGKHSEEMPVSSPINNTVSLVIRESVAHGSVGSLSSDGVKVRNLIIRLIVNKNTN